MRYGSVNNVTPIGHLRKCIVWAVSALANCLVLQFPNTRSKAKSMNLAQQRTPRRDPVGCVLSHIHDEPTGPGHELNRWIRTILQRGTWSLAISQTRHPTDCYRFLQRLSSSPIGTDANELRLVPLRARWLQAAVQRHPAKGFPIHY